MSATTVQCSTLVYHVHIHPSQYVSSGCSSCLPLVLLVALEVDRYNCWKDWWYTAVGGRSSRIYQSSGKLDNGSGRGGVVRGPVALRSSQTAGGRVVGRLVPKQWQLRVPLRTIRRFVSVVRSLSLYR